MSFPGGSVVKNPPARAGAVGDMSLIPGWGRSPGGGNDNSLQYSCQDSPVDRGAWQRVGHDWACTGAHAACGPLVPQPGIKPAPPALEAWSLNHRTDREVPQLLILAVALLLLAVLQVNTSKSQRVLEALESSIWNHDSGAWLLALYP